MADAYTVTPLSPLRKVIASRMAEATRTIPHFRLVADIEVDRLLDLCAQLRKDKPEVRLTLNHLLIKACANALIESPAINIQWSDAGIRHYSGADIAIVTAVEDGLSTPIVRDAHSKTIWRLAQEVNELTARAANNTLKMAEIEGGSFSLSNLGMYGIDQFDAIINTPQCAILAVGAAKPRIRVSESREPRVATVMTVTLSVDHRAIDGATGAQFLTTLRGYLEEPEGLRPAKEGA